MATWESPILLILRDSEGHMSIPLVMVALGWRMEEVGVRIVSMVTWPTGTALWSLNSGTLRDT